MKKSNKPSKCWNCAKLGKCQLLRPCKDFVKYDYSNSDHITQAKVAKLCKVAINTILRWLREDEVRALEKIRERTGLALDYVKIPGAKRKRRFIEKEAAEV